MCRASSTTARPLNRRMRQRSSAVPIAARSSPPAKRNGDRLLGLPGALAVSHGRHPRKRSPSRGYGRFHQDRAPAGRERGAKTGPRCLRGRESGTCGDRAGVDVHGPVGGVAMSRKPGESDYSCVEGIRRLRVSLAPHIGEGRVEPHPLLCRDVAPHCHDLILVATSIVHTSNMHISEIRDGLAETLSVAGMSRCGHRGQPLAHPTDERATHCGRGAAHGTDLAHTSAVLSPGTIARWVATAPVPPDRCGARSAGSPRMRSRAWSLVQKSESATSARTS